jgi:hypothetical protein
MYWTVMELEHLERQINILVLAAHDMESVIAACDELEQRPDGNPLADALATAIAVCYARPFSPTNGIGQLKKQWRPASGTQEREIHDWLVRDRSKRYAHTERAGDRLVLHSGDLETGFDGLVEISTPFPRERLGAIKALAQGLKEALLVEAFEVQQLLVDTVGRSETPQ